MNTRKKLTVRVCSGALAKLTQAMNEFNYRHPAAPITLSELCASLLHQKAFTPFREQEANVFRRRSLLGYANHMREVEG